MKRNARLVVWWGAAHLSVFAPTGAEMTEAMLAASREVPCTATTARLRD